MNNNGHIHSYRNDRDHWTWKKPVYYQWWVDMRFEANFKPGGGLIKGLYVECARGQCIRSITSWSNRWKTDRNTVKRFLDLLVARKDISIEVIPNRTIRLTVINYNYICPSSTTPRPVVSGVSEDSVPLSDPLAQKKSTTYTPTGTGPVEDGVPLSSKKKYHNRKNEDRCLTGNSLIEICDEKKVEGSNKKKNDSPVKSFDEKKEVNNKKKNNGLLFESNEAEYSQRKQTPYDPTH
jgi:hypothetical protein